MTETVRLAKRVAELFGYSRGEATQLIEGGAVTVDGAVVEEPGLRVEPEAVIAILPTASLAPAEQVTILLHKPAGIAAAEAATLVTPDSQFAEDRSGLRFLKRHLAGLGLTDPLDSADSGLLVFTQDWRVRRKLVDDAARIEQEYVAEVGGKISPDGLEMLNQTHNFNGKPVSVKASWQNETRLRFAFKAASSRLIPHLCEKVGLSIVSIKRIRIGRIPMAGLPSGQWRFLGEHEKF
ncbi:MAG: putative ribosomal large subunit pseudouridine synthase [Herminiimonas sp.]|nr:putative ribosomal large subunit pseudouridine synthase [Herminiimonas sp.]